MHVKLVAYEYVPLGFEMAIENTKGKIWNLWYNVQLSDDPERWDSEVKSINNLQAKLGDLSADHRLIRALIAEFCRVHPLFPEGSMFEEFRRYVQENILAFSLAINS